MSAETAEWLNTMTLQGFMTERLKFYGRPKGMAWHYDIDLQGAESNHYPGAIPREDVTRRLFNWEPVVGDVRTLVTLDGEDVLIIDPERISIVHPQTRKIMNIRAEGYQPHHYQEWLLDDVELLLDGGAEISSAGLLRDGAVAWVQVQLPDSVDTPEGLTGRPFLLAATSLDSSLATGFTRGAQIVQCDNTLSSARQDSTATTIKFKHTSKSLGRRTLAVRGALDLLAEAGEDFQAEVKALAAIPVTDAQFEAWLQLEAPIPDVKPGGKPGKAQTMPQNHQDELRYLYNKVDFVSDYKGTALGVLQAANTYAQHSAIVRGMERAERNALNMVTGKAATADADSLARLNLVLAA